MKPIISVCKLIMLIMCANTAFAQRLDTATNILDAETQRKIDSLEASINYKTGKVTLRDIATLNIPEGFKFIPADNTRMIVEDFWGNPGGTDFLGMIVKADYKVVDEDTWAFVITYDESGYVKDDDADKIDYNDLKKDIQESEEEENKERAKQGYPTVHFIDWAAKPYYDKNNKVLHWAKQLQFSNVDNRTLNYDVRVLGRKGVLSFNAVGNMEHLADINQHIPDVLKMASFNDGNKYSDFNPDIDKVAAYTIGGLIAGKLIAKTGLFLLLLKNIKLVLLAVVGIIAATRKRIARLFSKKKQEDADATPADPMAFLETPATDKEEPANDKPADSNT